MPDWVEYLLRIILAVALGFMMGFERQIRLKVGGIRTHAVVAAGACILMIVSKYGFSDSADFDAARIASQVVSGISFLGAGMIMYRQQSVHGLTSAAGIWLTAAIGMAVGAGMYFVSLGATAIVIAVQFIFHIPLNIFKDKYYNEIKVTFKSPTDDCPDVIKKLFDIKTFSEFRAKKQDDEIIYYAVINTKKQIDAAFIYNAINDYPFVISIEKTESSR
ncbi:MAG: MgtC/SapB family protein [Clostridia bacterium]|nr:MgtC/SapB family protein [Clostridia bacterium]